MSDLPAITRPNGRSYQPRKIQAVSWDNRDASTDDCGVFVLGTHDTERARPLATEAIRGWFDNQMTATAPVLRWVRSSYASDGPAWLEDPVSGRAAVQWTADYPEEHPDV